VSGKPFQSGSKIDWLAFTLWNWPMSPRLFDERNRPLSAFEMARVVYGMDDIEDLRPSQIPWTAEEVQDLAGLSAYHLQKLPKGMDGYSAQHMAGPARILSQGNSDMGVHCILSGDALDFTREPQAIIKTVIGGLGRFSRVDLACDDFDGKIDLPAVIAAARNRQLVTRAREGTVIDSFVLATGEPTGLTFYVGSRESDHYFRIYDKRLKSLEDGIPAEKLPAKWIRIEAELKGPAADNISRLIAKGEKVETILPEILNNYLSFRDQGNHARPSRWPVAQWWRDFLDNAGRLSVARKIVKGDMDKRRRWFARQAGPSMAMVGECFGAEELLEIMQHSQRNMKKNKRDEIEKFKENRAKRREILTAKDT
jgi:phage replication initiation protein